MLTIRNIHKIQGKSFNIIPQKSAGIITTVEVDTTEYRFQISTIGDDDYHLAFIVDRTLMEGGMGYMVELTDGRTHTRSLILKDNLSMENTLLKIEEMVTVYCKSQTPF